MPHAVLIVVTHLLGVGHLTRAAALGRGLARAGHDVTLVTGGRPAPLVRTDGLRVVQLPPVHCRGVDFRTLWGDDGQPIGDSIRRARIDGILNAFAAARPDVVVTETFPFGRRQLAAEFLALLAAAGDRPVRPAVLASVRDILNPPSRPEKAAEALERLGAHYDGVLVHGDPSVTALGASWPVDEALASRLRYTGYVAEDRPAVPQETGEGGEIFVSGGGSAASLPLFRAAADAAAAWSGAERWRLFVGHGVPAADFDALAGRASARLVVERARADFTRLLPGAVLSVSQAGYNTMIDLAIARARAVVVPFEQGNEAEQRLRAQCFAASGLVEVVPEADLTPAALAAAAHRALAKPRPAASPLDLGGIEGGCRDIEAAAEAATAVAVAEAALDQVLDCAEKAGTVLDFWWRDDDAVAPGPALDRLLALAERVGIPLALAVIPALTGPALAARLAATAADVAVLVHGLSHRNNAPPGAKKQELGFGPPASIAADLGQALAQCRALFGTRTLPVLVPPWNRIDPAIAHLLPAHGFAGLSTFGPRARWTVPGLSIANTHLDPIDWHGGRGLAPVPALLAGLAARITAIVDGAAPAEPLGILTHHLVHDPWVWHWLERMLRRLRHAPAVRFVKPARAFE